MLKFNSPTPIDNEIIINPNKIIMSKTDTRGVIMYANDYFMEVCGYEEYELMGRPHNVIRHPDMPKVIFKFIWDRLNKGENVNAVIKNLAKDGSYYWVMASFETTYDEFGNIKAHYARRKAIPNKAKVHVTDMYSKILKIEKNNEDIAEKFFYNLIEDSGLSYDDLFFKIIGMTENEYLNYFKEINTSSNILKDTKILNIDFDNIEKRDYSTKNKTDIEALKQKINELQKELSNEKKSKVNILGFIKRFFSNR